LNDMAGVEEKLKEGERDMSDPQLVVGMNYVI
jgi:hypothetical protein